MRRLFIFLGIGFVTLLVLGVIISLVLYVLEIRGFLQPKRTIATSIADFVVQANGTIITRDDNGVLKNQSNNSVISSFASNQTTLNENFYTEKNATEKTFSIFSYTSSKAVKKVSASQLNFTSAIDYLSLQYPLNSAVDYNPPAAKIFSGSVTAAADTLLLSQNAANVFAYQAPNLFFLQQSDPASTELSLITYNTATKQSSKNPNVGFASSRLFDNTIALTPVYTNSIGNVFVINSSKLIQTNQAVAANLIIKASADQLQFLNKKDNYYEVLEYSIPNSSSKVIAKIRIDKEITKAQVVGSSYFLLTSTGDLLEVAQ